jgi:inactivated superfamily I helicase
MCDEVFAPRYDELMDHFDSDEWTSLDDIDESSSAADGRTYMRFLTELSRWSDSLFGEVETFNNHHRLLGEEGDQLQDEFAEIVWDGRNDATNLQVFMSDADPADVLAIEAEFEEFNASFAISSLNDSGIGSELAEMLADVDDNCSCI